MADAGNHAHSFTTGYMNQNAVHSHSFTTNATGGNQPHNNIQPTTILNTFIYSGSNTRNIIQNNNYNIF